MARETIQEFKDILLRMESKIDVLQDSVLTNQHNINEIQKDLYVNNGQVCLFSQVSKLENRVDEHDKKISNFKAVCAFVGILFSAIMGILGIAKK
jgi:hypothetical protein